MTHPLIRLILRPQGLISNCLAFEASKSRLSEGHSEATAGLMKSLATPIEQNPGVRSEAAHTTLEVRIAPAQARPKVVYAVRSEPKHEPVRVAPVHVDHHGPDVLLTHRDRSAERPGTPTCPGFDRPLASAIDDAGAAAAAGKRDVVVWQGNRVAAVVGPDPEGRVRVTPFVEIPGGDG